MRENGLLDIAVEIKATSKIYSKSNMAKFTVVDNIEISIPKGEVFGFLGSNGAGKTTTIKMICGLVAPTNGSICLNGYDIIRNRSDAMRQIGVVLEGTRNIYWPLSAWQNLMYFGRLKGCSDRIIKERGEQILRELEMWDRRNDITRNFSRGMQQRVAIACALIADPSIIILDEPTLGLDVEATQIVKSLIARLARDYKKTIIITSHQLDVIQELCNRVVIIHKGKILADKSLADLLVLFGQDYYQIKMEGDFHGHWIDLLNDFTITQEDGMTLLTGQISDQSKLYSLLGKIRELGMSLISVASVEPKLEEVFVKLVKTEKGTNRHGDI